MKYMIPFSGVLSIDCDNESEIEDLAESAAYGFNAMFDNADEFELNEFVFDYSKISESE